MTLRDRQIGRLLQALAIMGGFAFLLFLLAGCSNFPKDDRTPEQIAADKSAVKVSCNRVVGPGYSANAATMSIDAKVISSGSVEVTPDCVAKFANVVVRPQAPPASGATQ